MNGCGTLGFPFTLSSIGTAVSMDFSWFNVLLWIGGVGIEFVVIGWRLLETKGRSPESIEELFEDKYS